MDYHELIHSFSTEEIPQDFGCTEGAAQFLKRRICAANSVLAPRFKPIPEGLGTGYGEFKSALRTFLVPYFITSDMWLNNVIPVFPQINYNVEPDGLYEEFLLATANIFADTFSPLFFALRSFAQTVQSRAKGSIIIQNRYAGKGRLEFYKIHKLLFAPVGRCTVVDLGLQEVCLFVKLDTYLSHASRALIKAI